ncbi:MAG: LEA type 2 family protein [Candidatus Aminicenantes bacterium]|nr:LEA type 2 family protein [Candidatus Aminicenantes bacterium]
MKRFVFRTIALLGILFFLVPPAEARSLKKDLKISLRERRVMDLSPEGLTLAFILEVANASSEPCWLTGYDYRVIAETSEYFRLNKTLDPPLGVAPSGRTLIALPVKFTYLYVGRTVSGLLEREKFGCTLVGGLVFSSQIGRRGERLNVALTGDIPVFRGFRIAAGPLEIRALSVGGADLSFRAEFRNESAFGLEVESIRYRLDLAGVRVAEGIARSGPVAPAGSAVLALPLLLEFFEMGADLFPILRNSEADFRLSGELLFRTAWGTHAVPFEEKGRVPIRRPG